MNPSPSTSENEVENVSLRLVTRSKAIKNAQAQTNESTDSSRLALKCKMRRKVCSKKAKIDKETPKKSPTINTNTELNAEYKLQSKEKEGPTTISETSSGGSLIVNKVYEPLQAAYDAYNSRIAAFTKLPKKIQEYPNPREEKVNLAVHQQVIRDSQTLMDGLPPAITRGPVSLKPDLQMIPEATPSMERDSSTIALPHFDEEPLVNHKLKNHATMMGWVEIPEIEEKIAKEMWADFQRHEEENLPSQYTPPFSAMYLTNHFHIEEDVQTLESETSKITMTTLPSYQGGYECLSFIKKISFMQRPQTNESDRINMNALVKVPMTCILPLVEFLKLRPKLWVKVASCLAEQEIWSDGIKVKEVLCMLPHTQQ